MENKNIVICYDGTGNEYSNNNTNVVNLFESLNKDNQVLFYDPGVGTFSILGRVLGRKIGICLGKLFGAGLQQNIEEGYEFLMNCYEPGDKIYIFGFSRGAFTARALAGMLFHFGLLRRGSKNLIPYVSNMYNSMKLSRSPTFKNLYFKYTKMRQNKKKSIVNRFKDTFCEDCKPHFIGVWDTVASMGLWWGKKFFDAELNKDVKFGYQAISIDEHRMKFPINLWRENINTRNNQIIEQVWFAGDHCDVGGSHEERELSDIALAWMMDKASECDLKLSNNWQQKLNQNAFGKIHDARKEKLYWLIWPKVKRKMPLYSIIHQSVLDRLNNNETRYNPKNLHKEYRISKNPSYCCLKDFKNESL